MTARPAASVERMRLTLSDMRSRDLPEVLLVERASYSHPWSQRIFADELAQRRSRRYRVARIGRELIAFAGAMRVDDEVHVNNIAVASEWRSMGVATALLLDLAGDARATGATAMTLEVRVSNDPAIALYRRFGFAPVGVRPGYYEETGEDALIMWVRGIDSEEYRERLARLATELEERMEVRW